MRTLLRLYYTLRPLKWRQLWYLLYYPFKRKFSRRKKIKASLIRTAIERPAINLNSLTTQHYYFPENRSFGFLNKDKTFAQNIDWNFSGNGLLWVFQLNYFEWLADDSLSPKVRLETMLNYVNSGKKKIGWLPYPSSLRMLSWTRFLSRFPKAPIEIFVALAEDAAWLYRFPEYQLDGNHLWENGLALLVAGQFLENRKFKERGEQILRSCIAEQILADGGHAEGSPMYQSLLLWRLLQGIELMGHLAESEPELLTFLKENAGRMLSWLRQMSFSNGTWPMTNDSAFGIAPDTKTVVEYANKLGVLSAELPLSASGYRMIKNGRMEIFVDVAPIQPSYQPGHSHADTGNFCLYLDGNPIVIDLGVSTYEVGNRRAYERSTAAHNVSRIGNDNSSDVWKSFRVGKRAKILAVSELGNNITLLYKDCCGNRFERSFSWMQNRLIIKDNLVNLKAKIFSGQLHFHPSIELEKLSDSSVKGGDCFFEFIGCERVEIFEYYYPETFNKTIISHGVKYKSANAELLVELNFG